MPLSAFFTLMFRDIVIVISLVSVLTIVDTLILRHGVVCSVLVNVLSAMSASLIAYLLFLVISRTMCVIHRICI